MLVDVMAKKVQFLDAIKTLVGVDDNSIVGESFRKCYRCSSGVALVMRTSSM